MLTINIQDSAETLFPSYYLFQVRLCLKIQFAEDDDPSEHREDNDSQQFNYLKTRESIYKEAAVRSYPAKRENSSCSRCGQKCLFNLLPSNCGLRKSVYSRGLQCNHTANCRVEPLFFYKTNERRWKSNISLVQGNARTSLQRRVDVSLLGDWPPKKNKKNRTTVHLANDARAPSKAVGVMDRMRR